MQKVILGRLLDKYENSEHRFEAGRKKGMKRVMLDIGKKDFPEYDFETAEVRDACNTAALALEKAGLVSIEWVERRPVMRRIVLNLDRVNESYQRVGRLSPKQLMIQVSDAIHQKLDGASVPWIIQWRDDMCANLEKTYKIPQSWKEDSQILPDLLRAFEEYDSLHGNVITQRLFSIRCYGNSKYFEKNVQKPFLSAAKKYSGELAELSRKADMGERELMTDLGIYPMPELYELAGTGTLEMTGGPVELGRFGSCGMALPSTAVEQVEGFDLTGVKRIVFIENRTNYDEYLLTELAPGELVVYKGGFLSPKRGQFFAKLGCAAKDQVPVYYWADIDLGGFRMFEQLKACVPTLEPWRMTADNVRIYQSYGLRRENIYLDEVRRALEAGKYPCFREAMEEILRCGCTIEQEVFLSERETRRDVYADVH